MLTTSLAIMIRDQVSADVLLKHQTISTCNTD